VQLVTTVPSSLAAGREFGVPTSVVQSALKLATRTETGRESFRVDSFVAVVSGAGKAPKRSAALEATIGVSLVGTPRLIRELRKT